MIINVKNRNDLITLDLRLKQIRYVKGEEITFIDLSSTDSECYENLFNVDKKLFLETLFEDLVNDVPLNLNDLEILK